MNWRAFPWTEVAVLLLAACVLVFMTYAGYRRQLANAPRFDTYSSYDARAGGYRAWYELLQREGMRVVRFEQRPAFLDRSIATLIMSPSMLESMLRIQKTQDTSGMPQAIDLENLRDWVKRGGRLVWVTDGTWDAELSIPEAKKVGPARDEAVAVAISPVTSGVDSVSGTGRLRVRFSDAPALEPLVADGEGSVVAQYWLGKGTIVVVTDQSLFDNAHIQRANNAHLAYNLAVGQGSVAFDEWVHGYVSGASPWTILPKPVRAAFLIILLGLALVIVSTALRFGPTARLPENAERTSAEYLSSMAHLLARGKAGRKALRDLATLALHGVAQGLGLSERATTRDLIARLESGADGSERTAQLRELEELRALDRPSDEDLVRAGVLCASLRKEYTRYGRIRFGRRAAPVRRSA